MTLIAASILPFGSTGGGLGRQFHWLERAESQEMKSVVVCGSVFVGSHHMTAQVNDTVGYEGEVYSIAAIRGDLFHPKTIGLRPVPISTACYRGFFCQYLIAGNEIVLDELWVRLEGEIGGESQLVAAPSVNGRRPSFDKDEYCFRYSSLGFPVMFTGQLVLARDFISELYVHMGFQAPWKYRKVLEFDFVGGIATASRNVSKHIAATRAAILESSVSSSPIVGSGLADWIGESFERVYEPERWLSEPVRRSPIRQALRLMHAGSRRLEVMTMLRKELRLTLDQVKSVVNDPGALLLEDSEYRIQQLRSALEGLGAVVDITDLESRKPIYVESQPSDE